MARPRRNDFLIPTLGVLFDGIAIELAFLFSYWLRFRTTYFSFLSLSESTPPLEAYILGSLVIIPLWWIVFNSRSMYGARRNVAVGDEFLNVVKLVTVGMLIVMSAAFFYRAFSYSRIVFGMLWIFSIAFIFLERLLVFQIEKVIYAKGKELRNAVIIGSGRTANKIYETLHNHPMLGYKFVGYFGETECDNALPLSKEKYLGKLTHVHLEIEKHYVELALVALHLDEHKDLTGLLRDCEGDNVEFLMVPDILELMASEMRVKEVEGIPFIKIKGVSMTTWGRIIKRAFDLVFGLILVALSSWLLVVIAIAIKLGSKGPVFFLQERVGFDGEPFMMMKFRSMIVDAEKHDVPSVMGGKSEPLNTDMKISHKSVPRLDIAYCTPIGRFLRRSSLDELPQLFNVIKGEMSLVGPRPERMFYVEKFKDVIPKYLDRHRVKTGMTGWAQIHGLRGDTSLEERIKYDLYYIENWSLMLDIRILFRTVGAVIFHAD